MLRAGLLLLILLLPALAKPTLAWADTAVRMRVGDHPAHGRLVFDWPQRIGYRLEETDGKLVLRFAEPAAFDATSIRRPPRNMRDIAAEGDTATILLAPGARARVYRLGNRVVVDALDAPRPAGRAAPQPVAAPPPGAPPRPAPQEAAPASAPPPVQRAPQPAPASPAVQPAAAPEQAPVPQTDIAAAPAARPVQASPGRLLVPAGAEVGAALVPRGEAWLLVLDAPVALDIGALSNGPLAGTQATRGAHATVLRLPRAALATPLLTRHRDGWLIEQVEAPPTLRSIRPEFEPGPPPRLMLRAARPASSVAVLDPETGGTLLVGTVREGGEATPAGRRVAAFEVLPTRLGAAILPRADSVTLRALPAGFAADPGRGVALVLGPDPDAADAAAALSRLFDLPGEPMAALVQRERNANLAIAGAPPLGRGPPRLRAAEALLALGFGAEAQAMAALAMREDPRAAEDPKARALHGAAALVAGRLNEADGLRDARLPESDELLLWRGLFAAARGEEGGAAQIAASLPILRAWPAPLRDRLAPLAAMALAEGGEAAAARRLLAGQENTPAFALAEGRLLEAAGDAEGALARYDAVARGRDRRARANAMRRAAELRLASGAVDAAGAAAAMEAVLAAWRGDAQELRARTRLAELRLQAGQARSAFDALREAEQVFADAAAQLRPKQAAALLAAIETEPPVAAVALFDTHAALLPPGAPTEQALTALAERLAALDLVDRARHVLAGALARSEGGESRARIGLSLANLALGAGDAAGARKALEETRAAAVPEELRVARLRTESHVLTALGEHDLAAARLREAGPAAFAELAELLAARQDWAGASAAMQSHLAGILPVAPEPLNDETRRLVARAAALLALAGDEPGLAALRAAEGGRMEEGAFAEAFGLLTAGRIGGIGDLPRLRRELEVARLLPAQLERLRPGSGAAR
ncbi:hypothetical protein [Roseomonas sp. AR75]|uniref:hypothetical protein n=1 Tax=Roseomonas sp. AR75 TaxID=2562311 RepID=UPI0010C1300B|nr:hypothetical protein [Roseomonas sp. AR75]